MTRLAIIFIVACTLLGALFYVWKLDTDKQVAVTGAAIEARKTEIEAKLNAESEGTVVYALRDVREGAVITADALEQRSISLSKIPKDAILKLSNVIGKKAKYGLSQGQIISPHDI